MEGKENVNALSRGDLILNLLDEASNAANMIRANLLAMGVSNQNRASMEASAHNAKALVQAQTLHPPFLEPPTPLTPRALKQCAASSMAPTPFSGEQFASPKQLLASTAKMHDNEHASTRREHHLHQQQQRCHHPMSLSTAKEHDNEHTPIQQQQQQQQQQMQHQHHQQNHYQHQHQQHHQHHQHHLMCPLLSHHASCGETTDLQQQQQQHEHTTHSFNASTGQPASSDSAQLTPNRYQTRELLARVAEAYEGQHSGNRLARVEHYEAYKGQYIIDQYARVEHSEAYERQYNINPLARVEYSEDVVEFDPWSLDTQSRHHESLMALREDRDEIEEASRLILQQMDSELTSVFDGMTYNNHTGQGREASLSMVGPSGLLRDTASSSGVRGPAGVNNVGGSRHLAVFGSSLLSHSRGGSVDGTQGAVSEGTGVLMGSPRSMMSESARSGATYGNYALPLQSALSPTATSPHSHATHQGAARSSKAGKEGAWVGMREDGSRGGSAAVPQLHVTKMDVLVRIQKANALLNSRHLPSRISTQQLATNSASAAAASSAAAIEAALRSERPTATTDPNTTASTTKGGSNKGGVVDQEAMPPMPPLLGSNKDVAITYQELMRKQARHTKQKLQQQQGREGSASCRILKQQPSLIAASIASLERPSASSAAMGSGPQESRSVSHDATRRRRDSMVMLKLHDACGANSRSNTLTAAAAKRTPSLVKQPLLTSLSLRFIQAPPPPLKLGTDLGQQEVTSSRRAHAHGQDSDLTAGRDQLPSRTLQQDSQHVAKPKLQMPGQHRSVSVDRVEWARPITSPSGSHVLPHCAPRPPTKGGVGELAHASSKARASTTQRNQAKPWGAAARQPSPHPSEHCNNNNSNSRTQRSMSVPPSAAHRMQRQRSSTPERGPAVEGATSASSPWVLHGRDQNTGRWQMLSLGEDPLGEDPLGQDPHPSEQVAQPQEHAAGMQEQGGPLAADWHGGVQVPCAGRRRTLTQPAPIPAPASPPDTHGAGARFVQQPTSQQLPSSVSSSLLSPPCSPPRLLPTSGNAPRFPTLLRSALDAHTMLELASSPVLPELSAPPHISPHISASPQISPCSSIDSIHQFRQGPPHQFGRGPPHSLFGPMVLEAEILPRKAVQVELYPLPLPTGDYLADVAQRLSFTAAATEGGMHASSADKAGHHSIAGQSDSRLAQQGRLVEQAGIGGQTGSRLAQQESLVWQPELSPRNADCQDSLAGGDFFGHQSTPVVSCPSTCVATAAATATTAAATLATAVCVAAKESMSLPLSRNTPCAVDAPASSASAGSVCHEEGMSLLESVTQRAQHSRNSVASCGDRSVSSGGGTSWLTFSAARRMASLEQRGLVPSARSPTAVAPQLLVPALVAVQDGNACSPALDAVQHVPVATTTAPAADPAQHLFCMHATTDVSGVNDDDDIKPRALPFTRSVESSQLPFMRSVDPSLLSTADLNKNSPFAQCNASGDGPVWAATVIQTSSFAMQPNSGAPRSVGLNKSLDTTVDAVADAADDIDDPSLVASEQQSLAMTMMTDTDDDDDDLQLGADEQQSLMMTVRTDADDHDDEDADPRLVADEQQSLTCCAVQSMIAAASNSLASSHALTPSASTNGAASPSPAHLPLQAPPCVDHVLDNCSPNQDGLQAATPAAPHCSDANYGPCDSLAGVDAATAANKLPDGTSLGGAVRKGSCAHLPSPGTPGSIGDKLFSRTARSALKLAAGCQAGRQGGQQHTCSAAAESSSETKDLGSTASPTASNSMGSTGLDAVNCEGAEGSWEGAEGSCEVRWQQPAAHTPTKASSCADPEMSQQWAAALQQPSKGTGEEAVSPAHNSTNANICDQSRLKWLGCLAGLFRRK